MFYCKLNSIQLYDDDCDLIYVFITSWDAVDDDDVVTPINHLIIWFTDWLKNVSVNATCHTDCATSSKYFN